jgi:DNA-binding NtrC family response regulator
MAVGNLDGRLGAAARIARGRGAPVRHADGVEAALALLRSGHRADLLMVDAAADIRSLAARLQAARLAVPIVACGDASDAGTAAAAVHAGACEYIPLPEDLDVIAAILAAVAGDRRESAIQDSMIQDSMIQDSIDRRAAAPAGRGRGGQDAGQAAADAALAAETAPRSLFGRTVADVERDLILETLRRCLGNRTHAAGILGISVRTLRNKLTVYAAEGINVPPPNNGDIRGAA